MSNLYRKKAHFFSTRKIASRLSNYISVSVWKGAPPQIQRYETSWSCGRCISKLSKSWSCSWPKPDVFSCQENPCSRRSEGSRKFQPKEWGKEQYWPLRKWYRHPAAPERWVGTSRFELILSFHWLYPQTHRDLQLLLSLSQPQLVTPHALCFRKRSLKILRHILRIWVSRRNLWVHTNNRCSLLAHPYLHLVELHQSGNNSSPIVGSRGLPPRLYWDRQCRIPYTSSSSRIRRLLYGERAFLEHERGQEQGLVKERGTIEPLVANERLAITANTR